MQNEAELQAELDRVQPSLQALLDGLNQVLLGKEKLVREVVTGVLAGGHILLEGLPGLGKTELVKGLARLCSIDFKRIQFTPDLLPSDITGSFILEQNVSGSRNFNFQEGPVFTNILLGDEINRASPKTQSALLEAMAERSVTVMGETRELPKPFFVLATQNPIELEGTYPLPEAQIDRFLFKIHLDRPDPQVLTDIVANRAAGRPPEGNAVIDLSMLRAVFELVSEIYISEPVAAYIARLVEASHPDSQSAPESVRKYVRFGGSPRAAIALGEAARADAVLHGRHQAGFDSVTALFFAVMNHRIILDYSARLDSVNVRQVIDDIINAVDSHSKPLPSGLKQSTAV